MTFVNKEEIGDEKEPAAGERKGRGKGANWNSGGQVGLSGFGQDHWAGEMRSWYQDQWWDSGTWRENQRQKG